MLRKALVASKVATHKLATNQNLSETLGRLPEDALVVAFWNPSGTVKFANRMISMMSPATNGFRIPAFPETSPIGWAMRAEKLQLTFQTVIPPDTIDAVGNFVQSVRRPPE